MLEGLALAYRCPGQLRQEHSGSVFTFETPQVRQHLGGFRFRCLLLRQQKQGAKSCSAGLRLKQCLTDERRSGQSVLKGQALKISLLLHRQRDLKRGFGSLVVWLSFRPRCHRFEQWSQKK